MPILLPSNQPPNRFYRGGPQIDRFRGSEPLSNGPDPSFQPEDWVASTTPCNGCHPLGLTKLPDGRWLADAITERPDHWLGPGHIAAFGVDTMLLVKLLDAGQRLPVHAHPDVSWARRHIPGAAHGKAEAWYVLAGGEVHLGLREDISADTLRELVTSQDVETLLSQLHRLEVRPHQTVYVPPGMLHAIGKDVLVVEVQEPSDLSVLLEWTGFAIDGAQHGHLGVGWDTALTAVDCKGRSREEIQGLVVSVDGSKDNGKAKRQNVLAPPCDHFFRMEMVQLEGGEGQTLHRGFAVLIVLDGLLTMSAAPASAFNSLTLRKGNTALLAYADGDLTLHGTGKVLIARPPKV